MRVLRSCPAGGPVSLLWVVWTSISFIAHPGDSEKIVVSHRVLNVPMGKTISIQPDDLTILPPGDAPCLITATEGEPIWARVGKISPQVFGCRFKPNVVSYSHNGSPLLEEDRIQFMVYYFEEATGTQQETVTMTVKILANQSLETVALGPLSDHLSLSSSTGLSEPINSSLVRFSYNYQEGASCVVSYQEPSRSLPFPIAGVIEGSNHLTISNFSMDCRDFLMENFRYRHSGSRSPDLDYIPLAVELEDPREEWDWIVRERIFLEVQLGAEMEANHPPQIIVNSSTELRVQQFAVYALDSEILSATDNETSSNDLVFEIVTDLDREEDGFIANLQENTRRVRSFYQEDLVNRQIVYHPPTKVLSEEKEVEMEFVVRDGHHVASQPARLRIVALPTKTNSPRLVFNGGLVVPEGGSRTITSDDIRIVDQDNLQNVEIHVKGGLRHGRLEVNGRPGTVFTVRDIENKLVVYRHDNSDTTEDRIIVRITDGRHGMRARIPIIILPIDDNSPYLLTHEALDVQTGGYAQITNRNLNATDKDGKDRRISYVVKSSSKAGQIVKRRSDLSGGIPVTRFTQDEVDAGRIYYQNLGGESTFDTLEFRLMDDNDPPNKSGKYTLEVRIVPANDLPPNLFEGGTRRILIVNETELGILRKEILWYEDVEFPRDDVVYTITSQPHYPSTPLTLDAGRFITIDNGTRKWDLAAVGSAPALRSFTQRAVDEGQVAYLPPREDIGLINRTARMVFAVSDTYGNSIIEQVLQIIILPVDDREPQVPTKPLRVTIGGSMRLTSDVILVSDKDADQKKLKFVVEGKPRNGELLRDGLVMAVGDQFTFDDVNTFDIKYIQNGSEEMEDSFELSASDGLRKFSISFPVEVLQTTSHRPQPLTDLDNRLEVDEGGMVFIGPENLAATDNDTDANLLNFLIMKSPEFGEIRLAGSRADQFSQADIIGSRVTYVHTGGEVGRRRLVDSITFTVLDQSPPPPAAETVPLIDLEVTILPLDNSAPELIVGGPVVVVDGKPASITPEIVTARDVDSPSETLLFIVVQTPMWGFLERSKSNTRSGRSQTSRRISSFTLSDLTEGTIQYVPSNLSKGGPPSDSFFIYVTDGQNQSPLSQIEIAVLPPNTRLPDFEIGNLLVEEGGEKEFRIQLTGGASRLEDADELLLSVASQPLYGELVLVRTAQLPGGFKELRFHDVSFADIENGIQMVYRHDGSESKEDRFTLSLSDGTHVVKRTPVVNVTPVNDMKPELVRNIPLPVDFGGSKLITASILKATDDDSTSSEISFVLVTTPSKGVLELELTGREKALNAPLAGAWKQLEVGDNFTQSSIDDSRVRYVHTTELDRETANDRFLFRVTDIVNYLPSAAFHIDIYRSNPKRILLRNLGISVEERGVEVITSDSLSADDGGRQQKDLLFSVDEGPGLGSLEFMDQDGRNSLVSKFTQADILARRLVYRNRDPGARDSFSVTVNGSRNTPSSSATVDIEIRPILRSLPMLLANVPLTVMQGGNATVSSAHLFIASEEEDVTAHNLTYILVERPKNGDLLVRGHSVQRSFTQLEVESGYVIYHGDDSDDHMTDYFLFNITDGRHVGSYLVNGTVQTKPAFFNILIQPIARDFPRLIRNLVPERLETLSGSSRKLGFIISSDYLKVSHPSFDTSDISFVLRETPSEGRLEYIDTERPIRRKFTQQDIDEEKVAFVLKENPSTTTNDSFTFRIEDNSRKNGPEETFRFLLRWATVELAHNQYTVCEDSRSVSIKIVRRGLTTNHVTANIRTKELSAKEDDDFVPPTDGTLVFEPGVTELFWTIEIVNDRIETESNEKFKVLLRNANQAVLGSTNKAVVHLVNVEHGRCAFDESPLSRGFPSSEREPSKSVGRHQEFEDSYDDQAFEGFGEKEEDDDYPDNTGPYLSDDLTFDMPRAKGSRSQKQNRPRDTTIKDRRKWKDVNDNDDDYDDDGSDDEGVVAGDWKLGYQKRSQFEGLSTKKKNKMEHPLQKYRKGGRGRGNRGGKGKEKKPLFDDDFRQESGRRKEPTATTISTTTTTQDIPGAFVPQECTRDTKGLLYFDLLSSKMHRCNGQRWEPWGWGAGDGYQYTALLKDAAGPEPDEEDTAPPPPPPPLLPAHPPPTSHPTGKSSTSSHESSPRPKHQKKMCRSGWSAYGDSCYRLGSERSNWNDAEFGCRRDGGHLTDVRSKDHLRWLSQTIATGSNYWIGLTDKQSPGVWRYSWGAPSTPFFNWRRAYPRLNGRHGNCVMVRKNLEWMNKACDSGRANSICVQSQAQRSRRQPYLRLVNQ